MTASKGYVYLDDLTIGVTVGSANIEDNYFRVKRKGKVVVSSFLFVWVLKRPCWQAVRFKIQGFY